MEHDHSTGSSAKRLKELQKRLPQSEAGLYLVGKKYLRVEQQPDGEPTYVSERKNVVTSFLLPKRYGNLGYLAHSSLAGSYFAAMSVGDEVILLPEQGEYLRFRVTSIYRYRALQPRNPRSNFINLQTNQLCSAGDVFRQVYMGDEHVVLQTCIEKGDILAWGRLFVFAESVERGERMVDSAHA